MEQINLKEELKKLNPMSRDIDIEIFANSLKIYLEAMENINKNGVICLHPRTGVPMENPFLKIKNQQSLILNKMKNIKTGNILK